MSDDTGTPAVDQDGNPITPAFSPEQEKFIETLLDKQSDKLTSHFGRISKEQVGKSFEENNIDLEKINEQLSSQLYGGDVTGAVNKIIDDRDATSKKLFQDKLVAMTSELERYKEDPMFDKISKSVNELAQDAMENKGFPPGPAVDVAFQTAKANYFENKDPDYRLNMAGTGKRTRRTKTPTLPETFKAQAAKDINSGLFKNEADWMEALSPGQKEKYGI